MIRHENHEQAAERVLSVTESLHNAPSDAAVASTVADAASRLVGDAPSVVYLVRADRLVPVGTAEEMRANPTDPDSHGVDDDGLVPAAFRAGKSERVTDPAADDWQSGEGGGALVHPLDEYGVLVVGVPEGTDPSPTVRRLVELLAANAVSTLGRLERETKLAAREAVIETLHAKHRELVDAESRAAVARIVSDTARTMFDDSPAAVFLWDEQAGCLRAPATSNDPKTVAETPRIVPGEGHVWDAFVDGETRLVSDDADSELVVPIDNHGVLLLGPTGADEFDDTGIECAELLATAARSALNRTERDATLERQQSRLQEQADRIARQNRTNTMVRKIQRALVQAQSTAETREEVCEQFAECDHVAFAWIGHRSADEGTLHADAWSGDGWDFLDHLLGTRDDEYPLPHRAVETGEPCTVDSIAKSDAFASWRMPAMNWNFRSVACLPLSWKDHRHGFLELYGTKPSTFDDPEVAVLSELATTVASAISTAKRREALVSGQFTALELEFGDAADPLAGLARRIGCELETDGVVPRSDGGWLVYLDVHEDDVDDLIAACDHFVRIEDVTHVRSDGEHALLGLTITEFPLIETLGEYGATIQSLTIRPASETVSLTIPPTIDVRTFVETCERKFGEVALVRRESSDETGVVSDLRYGLEDIVTEKQFEALQSGFVNGYFQVPRKHTGEEIAAKMDVSGPTFQHHLRRGIHRILTRVFEDGTGN